LPTSGYSLRMERKVVDRKLTEKQQGLEDFLNGMAIIIGEGGLDTVIESYDGSTKSPFEVLNYAAAALLLQIPIKVLTKNCTWDKKTVREVLDALTIGVESSLDGTILDEAEVSMSTVTIREGESAVDALERTLKEFKMEKNNV
jgi:hypothetical protein